MRYPFRYYGRQPLDWFEGANLGHLFELVFERAPSAEQKAEIARLFESMLATGPAQPSNEPWLWSGRFAAFGFGERWTSGAHAAFSRIADLALAIHRVASLEAVYFRNARGEGGSAWDAWSVAVAPTPPAGPRFPPYDDIGWYKRPTDPNAPDAVADPAFEEARRSARAEHARRSAQREAEAKLASGDIALVPLPESERAPAFLDTTAEARAKYGFGERDLVAVHPTGRVLAALASDDGYRRALHLVDDEGKRVRVALPQTTNLQRPAIREDGGAALVGDRRALYEIALPSGEARLLWTATSEEGDIEAVAYAAGARPVVLTNKRLLLFERAAAGLERIAALAAGPRAFGVLLEGHAFIVGAPVEKKGVIVVGEAAGKLKALATFATAAWGPRTVDGRTFLAGNDGEYELVNLETVWRAFAEPLLAKQQREKQREQPKATRGKSKRPVIEVVARASAEVPADDEPVAAPELLAKLGPTIAVAVSRKGRVAALVPTDGYFTSDVAWIDANGDARRTTPPGNRGLRGIAIDETRAFTCNVDAVLAVDLDSAGPLRTVYERAYGEVGNLTYLAALDGGRLIVSAEKGVLLLSPRADGTFEKVAFQKVTKCGAALGTASGRAVLAIGQGKERVIAFAVHADALEPIAKLTNDFVQIAIRGERGFAVDRAGTYHELVGLELVGADQGR